MFWLTHSQEEMKMAFLRHIALRAKDMEASRRFYEMIGLKYVDYRPGGRGLDLTDGTSNMTIIQYDGKERTPLEEGTEFIHFGVIVEDLAGVYKALQESGATLLRDNIKTRDDIDADQLPTRSFKVEDPDGNVIDVTCAKDEWRGVTI